MLSEGILQVAAFCPSIRRLEALEKIGYGFGAGSADA